MSMSLSLPHVALWCFVVVVSRAAAQFGGVPGLGLGVPGMHGGLSSLGPMGQPVGGGMPYGGPMGGSPGVLGQGPVHPMIDLPA